MGPIRKRKLRCGQFDGRVSDYGFNFYATQTWSDVPKKDGRCIQMAWMRGGKFPDMPFNQQLTFPCELSFSSRQDDPLSLSS